MPRTKEEEAEYQDLIKELNAYKQQTQNNAMTHFSDNYAAKPESEEFKAGRTMPRPAQTALKIAQALSFGLIPKLTGPKTSDIVLGATTQFQEDYPKTSFGIDLTGSMVPGAFGFSVGPRIAKTGGRTLPSVVDMNAARRIGGAAMSGGVEGGLSGFGSSDAMTNTDLMKDILLQATVGAFGGGSGSAATNILGAASRNVGERTSTKVALNEAQKRLIQALIRDTPEGQDFAPVALARLKALGSEGALLDTGENARQMADLLATLPGRGKTELRDFVETRATTRGERMAQAGQGSLETGNKRLVSTLDDLAEQRSRDAGPLYRLLETMTIDDSSGTIANIVRRAKEIGATRIARNIAETQKVTRGGKGWTLTNSETNNFNASDLANIKEGLDDLIRKQTDAVTGRRSKLGNSYVELRNKLRNELVARTPDLETGESVYANALDAWAGPSAVSDAADLGRTVLNRSLSADQLRKELVNMSQSELEAVKIGAFEAIRDKVGTSKSGRTEMMNLVENFVPREKLQVLFGTPDKFDQFYRTMISERTMREADALGRGSQSVGRAAAAGDINADVVMDVGNMASGGTPEMISRGFRLFNQAQLPEKTRNEFARLLMMRGPQAETDLFKMEKVARELAKNRARRAASIGGVGGGLTPDLTQNK